MLQYKQYMLSNRNRFHGPNSLRFVYRNGGTVHSHICKVKYMANPRIKESRFAVVVSKKVHRSAVGRNLIRRRFYEVIRSRIPDIKPGMDIILIIVSGEALTVSYKEVQSTIDQLFREAVLYE